MPPAPAPRRRPAPLLPRGSAAPAAARTGAPAAAALLAALLAPPARADAPATPPGPGTSPAAPAGGATTGPAAASPGAGPTQPAGPAQPGPSTSAPAGPAQPGSATDSADAPQPAPSDSPPAAGDVAARPAPADSSTPAAAPAGPGEGPTATPARPPAPAPAAPLRPPRVDGAYLGGTLASSLSFARVNNFPTPDPFTGGGASIRVGEAVYRWMTIGVEITGNWAYRFADPRQRLLQGAFLIDFGFYPSKTVPISLRAGFGAGGGAVREAGRPARSGFGGAVFTASVRYELFPTAARKRPKRGGGFSVGPELGWVGFTPAGKGRPMSNTIYLGLFIGYYFGS